MLKPPVIDQPFHSISFDIVGPIAKPTKRGSEFILIVVIMLHGQKHFLYLIIKLELLQSV